MAELFGVKTPAVNKHLKNIYASGELTPAATISKMETVQTEGGREVTREVEFYNLDAVIAALEQRRDKTRALKQGMMQELLTGRTRLI